MQTNGRFSAHPTDEAVYKCIVNKDAGVKGASDDIDKQPRTGLVDIGADELSATDTTPPAPPTNVRVVP